MNDSDSNSDFQRLKETAWRRPLTPAEEDRLRQVLAAQPALQPRWEDEAALNRLLSRLPAAQVSSNFTARVMRAARETPAPANWAQRLALFPWLSRNWVPRVALGCAMICCGVVTFREYQAVHRARVARQAAGLTRLATLPPEWMKDFDTINNLNKVSVTDPELLALLR